MLVLPAAAVLAVVGGSAFATGGTAYQGDDYSKVDSSRSTITVCDKEADGNGVHADAVQDNGTSFITHDDNGSKAGCGSRYSWQGIAKHRTVEEHPFFDSKGDWHNDK